MTVIREIAAAKVNLTLKIFGRRPDGYHQLKSLVAFAGISDLVEFRPGAVPKITVEGPFAGDIDGENLVMRAANAVRLTRPDFATGTFRLIKRLPVAAGLGGGSADAGAALRALMQANGRQSATFDWLRLARNLGADVAVCLTQRASFITGIGDIVTPAPHLPELSIVIANPGIHLPTTAVYGALNAPPLGRPAVDERDTLMDPIGTVDQLIEYLKNTPNDLEATAFRLVPEISEVKAALASQDGCLIARLTGSGSSCFGLFRDLRSANTAERRIADSQPGWWIRASLIR
jgi:4-diphosphocytidyl-2-C-methyl-D-erythritol kinase